MRSQHTAGAGGTPLHGFSAPTRTWFAGAFDAPTQAQVGAWDAIASGEHALVVAPTGSGKTLAAFLAAIDRLLTEPAPADPTRRCRVLYVSPLKALAADVERNLRSPLVGITAAATAQGAPVADVRVGVRTGDTPANERRTFATKPPDVLITTPESLFLVLTSAARAGLAGVETVIVDEIHALAGTKRGAHLALSLERLDALLDRPAQRIGLSATVRPVETVASFLAGARSLPDGGRTTRVVQPPASKQLRIDVVVPVPDLADIPGTPMAGPDAADLSGSAAGPLVPDAPPSGSIWPHVTERVVDLITSHRSTIVFTNSRRSAERLTARINEVQAARLAEAAVADGEQAVAAVPDLRDHGSAWPATVTAQSGAGLAVPAEAVIARAHHGSMSREERTSIESALKAGSLQAVVATSSLELGIDMGAVDLVVQVGSPPSVASALQRIGRAGHQVGALSHGVVLPTHRGDLLAAATSSVRARDGRIEAVTVPANPLDVLAQQIVAMVATQDWEVSALLTLVRRASPFAQVSDAVVHAVLDMLAGRYPSEDFAELRPRIVWDRVAERISGRPGALRLAATSGGTIPDRGLYGVYVVGSEATTRGGRRVGELDEEMVYESRVGDTFTLGSSTWRIEDITPDRVLVSPAPGLPGRLPFWKGDAPARPAELGAAMGAMMREVEQARFTPDSLEGWGLDEWARDNLLGYLREQEATAGRLATDRVVVVERFRDELGDWRLVIHSPYGAAVHAPWALVLGARLRDRYGMDVAAMHSDDGIVLRLPEVEASWDPVAAWAADEGEQSERSQHSGADGQVSADDLVLDPETLRSEVVAALSGSAHFAARFREAAARSLLLPRRRPDRRQPLWQQRQRAAQLLSVASSYPDFPVVLEAVRECLQDDFDVPALERLMSDIGAHRVRVVEVSTPSPSPFAQSLLFSYVAQYLYEGDAPLAERRAAALTLDPTLLSDLLGEGMTDVADLLDVGALASVEAEVGLRTEGTRAKDAEGVLDLVRLLGPISTAELAERSVDASAVDGWLIDLAAARRVIPVRVAGEQQWVVVEDAGRLRDALGVALPMGLPEALLEPVPSALTDLVRRHARTHGPFRAGEVAARFGLGVGAVIPALATLVDRGQLASGTLRPADSHTPASSAMPGPDYCDSDVLRRVRRRSLAALRAEVEAVPPATLGVFLPRWHHVGRLRGVDGVMAAVDALAGTPVAASALESLILPARVRDYSPDLLDELTSAGEVVWVGAGSGPGSDGWVALLPADAAADLAPDLGDLVLTEVHQAVLDALGMGGGRFVRDVVEHVRAGWVGGAGDPPSGTDVVEAVWELAWAGWLTNDTLAPLRARLGTSPRPGTRAPRRPRARSLRTTALRTAALGASGFVGQAGATPSDAVGRWSLVVERTDDARRRTARALSLLDRDGLVVRGTVPESLAGGFSTVYTVLSRAEENGQVRRGYFVEGLGAAQFSLPDAVEALRGDARDAVSAPAMLLAATDPANPYGAALPWPEPVGLTEERSGHRPGRKVGASVVLVGGTPVLYLERGAKTLLSFTSDAARLAAAAAELAHHARAGALGRFTVSRADGGSALSYRSVLTDALTTAGFIATPRGLRLRS